MVYSVVESLLVDYVCVTRMRTTHLIYYCPFFYGKLYIIKKIDKLLKKGVLNVNWNNMWRDFV